MSELNQLILTTVFVAGGFWVFIRLSLKHIQIDAQRRDELHRKDINGVGSAVRADRIAEEFRSLTSMLTTLVETEEKKDRQWLVDKFLNGWRRP